MLLLITFFLNVFLHDILAEAWPWYLFKVEDMDGCFLLKNHSGTWSISSKQETNKRHSENILIYTVGLEV